MPEEGSPEAIAAALAEKEREAADLAAREAADKAAAENETVTLTKAEHDALQARVRVQEKADKDRKTAAAKKKADAEKQALEDRIKEAEDAGIGKELRESEAEKTQLRERLDRVLTGNAIRDAAGTRKWNTSAQRAAPKMVDLSKLERDESGTPTEESIKSALDTLEAEYPDIYTAEAQRPGGDKGRKKALQTPSNPTAIEESAGAKFDGYISPEEYMNTPFTVRNSPVFRARLEKSRQYWDDSFDHKDLNEG